ncbi:MAG: glycerol-3-phosphate dehydrogenase, partial [Steroidobacteraceae bacterium]
GARRGLNCDLLVVGGGINGAGITRDAAGRGLDVHLVERDDLASHTSSASTKLIHGGLRYLEQYEFRLVREALAERERLLRIAPHIIRPLRFVLPYAPGMRPRWLLRLGLFVYDHLERRERLAASRELDLRDGNAHDVLDARLTRGFEYSDCWVEDSRLVVLNALDAAERGAHIHTRTRLISLEARGDRWHAVCRDERGETFTLQPRAVANAAGAWVNDVVALAGLTPRVQVRGVKGSHLIFPRLYAGEHAYLLQGADRRVVFLIPFEERYTLVGTTDLPFDGDAAAPHITTEEARYLCDCINGYLARPVQPGDAVGAYSGVRALVDDDESQAQKVSRDYRLELQQDGTPPLLTVYGGKITTYRRLAEHALEHLLPALDRDIGDSWTASAPLPGGDFDGDVERVETGLRKSWPALDPSLLRRFAHTYGTRTHRLLQSVRTPADLGREFGLGLTERELRYLRETEWARNADDVLRRRTRLGLQADAALTAAVNDYFSTNARSMT